MNEPITAPPAPSSMSDAVRRPTLTLDVALYEGYLADGDLDEAQKRALLEALWSIIVGFVDLGFAVEPASKRPGDADIANEDFANPKIDLLHFETESTKDQFEKAADRDAIAPAGMEE